MKLFVGLGNHGTKYSGNRHNVGFMVLDALAANNGSPKWSKKFSGELAEIAINGEKILLLKPQTYMNNSGRSVIAAMSFYKLKPEQVTVFHDDLDLANAKLKIKTGGGHGGHNGLRDIDANIGKEYKRIRIGIGRPNHKDEVSDYVLHDFSKAERYEIDELIGNLSRNTDLLASGQDAELMNKLAN